MKRIALGLILSGWFLAPGGASAQQRGLFQRTAPAVSPLASPANDAISQRQMYEDIEVLRRLLIARLKKLVPPTYQLQGNPDRFNHFFLQPNQPFGWGTGNPYGIQGGFPNNNPYGSAGNGLVGFGGGGGLAGNPGTPFQGSTNLRNIYVAHSPLDSMEGVYLKGCGVVYTVTLPQNMAGKQMEVRPPAKVLSDWDRVRREIRNENAVSGGGSASGKKIGLADVILQTLAENGRHFKHLPPDERITVVITFRPENRSGGLPLAIYSGSGGGRTPVNSGSGGGAAQGSGGMPPAKGGSGGRLGNPKFGNPNPASGGNPGPEERTATAERDYELLGDLKMKQGKLDEALAAYQRALEIRPDSPEAATLHRKLAQVYLAQGKEKEAEAALARALKLRKEKASPPNQKFRNVAGGSGGPPARPASTLPAKLIISAPKRLLDQVGTGKMSLEDFTKQATVEYLNFSVK